MPVTTSAMRSWKFHPVAPRPSRVRCPMRVCLAEWYDGDVWNVWHRIIPVPGIYGYQVYTQHNIYISLCRSGQIWTSIWTCMRTCVHYNTGAQTRLVNVRKRRCTRYFACMERRGRQFHPVRTRTPSDERSSTRTVQSMYTRGRSHKQSLKATMHT